MPVKIPPNVPVEMRVPEGMPVTYVNYTFVQTVGADVVISFFQAVHPMYNTQEEVDAQLKTLPANCVGRIAMNALVADGLLRTVESLIHPATEGGDG